MQQPRDSDAPSPSGHNPSLSIWCGSNRQLAT